MQTLSILVVDDDRLVRDNIASHLKGHSVDFAADLAQARRKLDAGNHDICFIDLELGEDDNCSGLKLIPLAEEKGSYSVVMSGHDSEPYVDKAYGLGCRDFFPKTDVGGSVAKVLARYQQRRQQAQSEGLFEDQFVTVDPITRASITEALKYSASDLPVLILGPSGTGKTSLARILHDRSGRKGQFVSINCSSYTEDLLEAELFGYKKGAFTDAQDDRKGKLVLADGGTLFLDEIGAMSLKMQTKLLKALEEQVFYPLGSEKPETSRFRIISATLEELPSLVSSKKLRLDFFQRIHGVTVKLRPLAERRCDILPLLLRFNRDGRKLSFATGAKKRLVRHSWPGNVRELKKLVELLKADEQGRVTEPRIEQLLTSLPIMAVQEAGQAMTEEQYHFALEHGLRAMIDRAAQAVIRRSLAENGGNKRRVIAALRTNDHMVAKALQGWGSKSEKDGDSDE
jgi:two-component system nitrogen regulation response regulator GlnG